MLRAWDSGRFVSYADLPGWSGPPWSLPLVPGWRDLSERDLPEIVTEQWIRMTQTLLADLQRLPPERWGVADHTALRDHPADELKRVSEFCEIDWNGELETAAAGPRESPGAGRATQARRRPSQPARGPPPPHRRAGPRGPRLGRGSPRRSPGAGPRRVAAAQRLHRLVPPGAAPDGAARCWSAPTRRESWSACASPRARSTPTSATSTSRWGSRSSATGSRSARGSRSGTTATCPMPRRRSSLPGPTTPASSRATATTPATSLIHEVAWAGGQLWVIATAFSCLATLDVDHSFVPQWTPPFISELAPGDRCHLNGLCIVDDRPRYVTALGQTDEAGGWRENKAAGGCLIDIQANEVVVEGLSMPHSPRWHRDSLWVLESGKGELCRADPKSGETETVVELPGFTRGLAFAGNIAFVGLSQIRETATFGGLPADPAPRRAALRSLDGRHRRGRDRRLHPLRGPRAGGLRRRAAARQALPGGRRGALPTTAQSYVLPPHPQ